MSTMTDAKTGKIDDAKDAKQGGENPIASV
jgi:hypothetical protein